MPEWETSEKIESALINLLAKVQEQDVKITELENSCSANRSAISLVKVYKTHLLNLLAVIHRDGGHYTEEHGLDKSVADAEKRVSQWLEACDSLDDAYRKTMEGR